MARKPKNVNEEVGQLQQENSELQAQRHRTVMARPPHAEAKKDVREFVRRNGGRWTPPVRGFSLPILGADPSLALPPLDVSEAQFRDAMLCRLFPDQIEAVILEELDRTYADGEPEGPPRAERPAIVEEIDARIFALEVREEQAIRRAAAAGIVIERRPDADPSAVLGLPRRAA